MLRKLLIGTMLSTALTAGYAVPSFAEEVEVLHWWTSGGEAAALDVLKKNLEAQGVVWKDMPVAGGGGEAAMTALRARVTSGNPPTAVQALGFDITDWAKQGVVGDLGDIAATRRRWRAGVWTRHFERRARDFGLAPGRRTADPRRGHRAARAPAHRRGSTAATAARRSRRWYFADVFDAESMNIGQLLFGRLAGCRYPIIESMPVVDRFRVGHKCSYQVDRDMPTASG